MEIRFSIVFPPVAVLNALQASRKSPWLAPVTLVSRGVLAADEVRSQGVLWASGVQRGIDIQADWYAPTNVKSASHLHIFATPID